MISGELKGSRLLWKRSTSLAASVTLTWQPKRVTVFSQKGEKWWTLLLWEIRAHEWAWTVNSMQQLSKKIFSVVMFEGVSPNAPVMPLSASLPWWPLLRQFSHSPFDCRCELAKRKWCVSENEGPFFFVNPKAKYLYLHDVNCVQILAQREITRHYMWSQ